MEIYTSSKFRRAFKKLPRRIKKKARKQEKIFRDDPFDPRLKTHKLAGKYKDYWAFSIDRKYRIMFQFLDATKNKVAFINAGTHDIYK